MPSLRDLPLPAFPKVVAAADQKLRFALGFPWYLSLLAALPDVWRAWKEVRPVGPPVLVELEAPDVA